MCKKLKTLFLLVTITFIAHSQVIKDFGIKFGPTLTGHFTYCTNGYDRNEFMNLFRYDIGLFAGILDYKRLTFQAEIHYTVKGESEEDAVLTSPLYPGQVISRQVSNRFQYVSLAPIVKFNFYKSKSHEFYLLGGPRWDFRVGNFRSGYANPDDYIHVKNFKFEFGITTGIGYESSSGFLAEFRFDPNFTNTYSYKNDFTSYSKRHSTIMLLLGLNFRKMIDEEVKSQRVKGEKSKVKSKR